MRTVSSKDRMRSGNKGDISAFLLGAASQAAHFFPLCLNAEARWMRYQRLRSLGVFCLLAVFGGLLVWHLYVLQFNPRIAGANLEELRKRWHSYDTPQGKRGKILFRDGTLLAGNRKAARVIAEPELIDSKAYPAIQGLLTQITGQSPEKIMTKLTARKQRGVLVADGLSLDEAQQVKQLNQPGIFIRYYYERDYPHGDFGAAPTVGYAGREVQFHRSGLEHRFETQLCGMPGKVEYSRDRFHRRLPASVETTEPEPGRDLTTTLDPDVQLICETELRRAQKQNGAAWACIVVMEPHSGEIRGTATWPTFDPNKYVRQRGEDDSELNMLHQRVVEPGSTVKPLLVAAALDRGWLPENKRYVCNRRLVIDGYEIREAELNYVIGDNSGATLKEIVVHSSNRGMAQAAIEIGKDDVLAAYRDYGFFSRSGIELPGEERGLRPHSHAPAHEKWPEITLANTGFGQGMAVTPLQLATAYSVLANGGYWVKPTLVQGLSGEDPPAPEVEQEAAPQHLPHGETLLAGLGVGSAPVQAAGAHGRATLQKTRVLSSETCAKVNAWLAEVVQSGTGKRARLDRYNAAGKTGTAQIPGKGGYRKGAYTASFAGFFPAENPRYVVVVIFGEPKGQYYGGVVAAPVFKAVADRISYLQTSEFAGVANAAR